MFLSTATGANSQGTLGGPERAGTGALAGAIESGLRKMAPAPPGAFALAAVAACMWISFRLGQTSTFPGFLYFVFVVLAALYGGFLNYRFVPPIFSIANSPATRAALGAFEGVLSVSVAKACDKSNLCGVS